MPRLVMFNSISLDGYFTSSTNDMSWAHRYDPEWTTFISSNASGEAVMAFGRKTYDLMASYWPTPMAAKNNPGVAEAMNKLPKLVFSRTLDKADWSNTKLVKGDLASEVRKLKQAPGKDLVILGSGTIVSQLSEARLIDEYQIVLVPVALGAGRTLFEGQKSKLDLKLTKTRTFGNGNVVLSYEPAL
jgi:dihydrofolate reductase